MQASSRPVAAVSGAAAACRIGSSTAALAGTIPRKPRRVALSKTISHRLIELAALNQVRMATIGPLYIRIYRETSR
jgi:hypothetical protein